MIRAPRVVVSLLILAGAACHHTAPVVAAAPTSSTTPEVRPQSAPTDGRDAARRDSIARAAARADSLRRAAEAARSADEARTALTGPVHFEFNRDDILASDRPLMERKAAILAANPAMRIRIEGNADERGSDEFNLALGMRRAAALQQYLTTHGISADRLALTSNGEERPLCQDHQEPCWGENRRDDIVITAGGDRIAIGR